MHTSFIKLKQFNDLPKPIDDLIFQYTYAMTRVELHKKTNEVRTKTYNMPVPIAWKRFFRHNATFSVEFDWNTFLKNVDADIINPQAVSDTLNLLNWNSLRSKGNAISQFVRTSTKTSLKSRLLDRQLRRNVIHMVWHILSCAGRGDFTTHAWKNNNYHRFLTIPYFNRPLCSYYPPGKATTCWDLLQERTNRTFS